MEGEEKKQPQNFKAKHEILLLLRLSKARALPSDVTSRRRGEMTWIMKNRKIYNREWESE